MVLLVLDAAVAPVSSPVFFRARSSGAVFSTDASQKAQLDLGPAVSVQV